MSSRAETASRGRLLELTIILAALGPLLLSAGEARAQTDRPPAARKFDEFGDIQLSDLKARLDNFGVALQGEPGARGFVIVYRSHRDLPGLSSRLAVMSRKYIVDNRGLPKERIVTVDGGPALCLTQELWIVDPGAAPQPREDAYSRGFTDTAAARKFDEFYYPLPEDDMETYDGSGIGGTPDALEGFAAALRQEPRALAYVIAYKQYHPHRRRDPPGAAQRMMRAVKRDLVRVYGIAPARIRVADGGHRTWRQVELWVLPRGAHAPVATPNAFPRRGRARPSGKLEKV